MYPYMFPHTISNPFGEELTFESVIKENGVSKVIVKNKVQPDAGPPMHVHFKQDEFLRVDKGKLGYQILEKEEYFLNEGESVLLEKGTPHRFWNAGNDILECSGWVSPPNSLDYFLTGIYNSMTKSGKPEGDPFDTAFLITRYKTEYDMLIIPNFVKKVVMPVTVAVGKLLGKYKHFFDAPRPIK
ncbi:MAG: cupin domain-containing protein [Melioribacteraceae bacterium]|nr:cupin domain-containing protein [Melioribacteraceae bacterium]MDD3559683.1 cupin domain-containing protein [Melioribacteraceae bacterium]